MSADSSALPNGGLFDIDYIYVGGNDNRPNRDGIELQEDKSVFLSLAGDECDVVLLGRISNALFAHVA